MHFPSATLGLAPTYLGILAGPGVTTANARSQNLGSQPWRAGCQAPDARPFRAALLGTWALAWTAKGAPIRLRTISVPHLPKNR